MNRFLSNSIQIGGVAALIFAATPSSHGQARAGEVSAGKPFTINVNVRQEHDDNTTTANTNQDGAWVTKIRPSIDYRFSEDRTSFYARYSTSFEFFNERANDDVDQVHDFNLSLDHQFTDRYSIVIANAFSFSQEDSINESGFARRLGSDRIRNTGSIGLNAIWTNRFNTNTSYTNTLVNYFDDGPGNNFVGTTQNFMEHEIEQNFNWVVDPSTTAFLSYRYQRTDFDETLAGNPSRNSQSHFATVGVTHYLLPEWLVSAQGGAQIILRDATGSSDTISPYGSLSTRYNYLENSYVEGAYTYGTTNTDAAIFSNTISHTASAEIVHYFTPRLSVGALGQVQNSVFDQDATNPTFFVGSVEEWTLIGEVNAQYEFTNWLSAEVGYRHSTVDSEFGRQRDYWRNQVYLGVTGTY